MPTYVQYNEDGSILSAADWNFPGSQKVEFNVVRGYDGRLYKEGEEPIKPDEQVRKELFIQLRLERDRRIAETDYMVLPDYPMSETARENVKKYRQALRDITEQEGAPWDGGGENTPWPTLI